MTTIIDTLGAAIGAAVWAAEGAKPGRFGPTRRSLRRAVMAAMAAVPEMADTAAEWGPRGAIASRLLSAAERAGNALARGESSPLEYMASQDSPINMGGC